MLLIPSFAGTIGERKDHCAVRTAHPTAVTAVVLWKPQLCSWNGVTFTCIYDLEESGNFNKPSRQMATIKLHKLKTGTNKFFFTSE